MALVKRIVSLLILSMVTISCYESEDVPEEETVEPSEFTQKLLIEDYTGTWCVNCTGASHAIETAEIENHRFVPVAIHFGEGENADPMHNSFSSDLVAEYNPSEAFPQVNLNRNEAIWANDYLTSTLTAKLNRYAPVGLAINSTLVNSTTINVTVSVGFVEETTAVENYKLVVYLLEDGLIYPQHNGSLTDLPDIIEDYEHNNVLRFSLTNLFGDNLPNQIANDHRYVRVFDSVTIPNTIADNSKLKIVAFVLDKNDFCLNVQVAPINSNKDFD